MPNTHLPDGRAELVGRLQGLLETPGSRVLLTGEPGIGRTFLLERAVEGAAGAGVRVLHARATSAEFGLAYQGLHDLFAEVSLDDLAIPALQRDALAAVLHRGASGEVSDGAVLVAVDSALTALAAEAPLALAVDDLDLLDAESLAVLRYAITRRGLRARRLALLATAALPVFADPTSTALGELAPTDVLTIEPLSPEELGRVALAPGERRLTALELHALHEESGGNPTCAIEIRSLARGIELAPVSRLRADPALGMRVGELDETGRDVLAVMALLPAPSPEQLGEILGIATDPLTRLVDRGLVRLLDGRLSPVHALFARAALDALPADRRTVLHERIAAVVPDPAVRAHHLDRARPLGVDAELADALAEAGEASARLGATAPAVDLLTRALARTPGEDPRRLDRAVRSAELLVGMGEFGRAAGLLELLPLPSLDVAALDRVLLPLATAISSARGEAAARGMLARLGAAVAADPLRSALVRVCEAVVDGDRLAAGGTRATLRALADAGVAPAIRRRGLGALVHAGVKAGLGIDEALLAESEELAASMPRVSVADGAEAFLGMHAYQVERLEDSRRALQSARRRALDAGEHIAAGRFAIHLATVEALAGRLAEARAWLSEWDAVDPWPATPPPPLVSVRGVLALLDDDEHALERVLQAPYGPANAKHGEMVRSALRGYRAVRRAEWAEAVVHFTTARDLAEGLGVREPGSRMYLDISLGHALVALGRLEEALGVADFLAEISRGARPLLDGAALRLRGLVAEGEGRDAEAEELLRASIVALPEGSHARERAVSLVELARLLRARGRHGEAARAAEEAVRDALAGGDAPLVALARELRSAVEPRSFRGLLSPREHAVAVAAGAGLSNREIAAENFISVRTVETQLSAVYRKLGLRSRAELVRVMAEAAREGEVGAA